LPTETPKINRRDFWAVVLSLSGVVILAWTYLVWMAIDMKDMGSMGMPVWNTDYFTMMFLMWAIMMVGMMLPSVMPMVLIYTAIARKADQQGMPIAKTHTFVLGYLFVWTVFSLMATLMQWGLDSLALLSPMMISKSPYLGAGLLIAAGIYQWLPFKDKCLTHCRAPAHFISSHWREGGWGAFRMGVLHGAFCLGCCWILMLLLFVGGVMNILWIALITLFVLLEKVLFFGPEWGRVLGLVMVQAGIVFIVLAFL
jgi:predicted metal-binding membrane protein